MLVNITRKSIISGIIRTIKVEATEEQMKKYREGEHIQRVFPELSPHIREFILNGITKEEWNTTFPPEEDIKFKIHENEGYDD